MSLISSLENGSPLSLFTIMDIPCVAKIHSSLGIVALEEVDVMISTSGNLLYASITTNKYCQIGKGPQKSIFNVCHGSGGKEVI